MSDQTRPSRSRWAAVGAAVAVTVCGGGLFVVNAAGGGAVASSFVPITPCRLLDTRAASTVGARSTPVDAKDVIALNVQGTNGDCVIAATATAVAANVTTIDGTGASFLTVWPSDSAQPTASTNNWVAGQAPTPNKIDVKLSADGRISLYNDVGTVNVIIDVVGYYEPVVDPTPDGGVEFAEGATAELSTSAVAPTAITTLVVTAPAAGFVVVTATAMLNIPSGNSVNCEIGTTVAIGTTGEQFVGGNTVTVFTQSRGFSVPAGDTTFFQTCQQVAGDTNDTDVQHNFLTAVYSPNRV